MMRVRWRRLMPWKDLNAHPIQLFQISVPIWSRTWTSSFKMLSTYKQTRKHRPRRVSKSVKNCQRLPKSRQWSGILKSWKMSSRSESQKKMHFWKKLSMTIKHTKRSKPSGETWTLSCKTLLGLRCSLKSPTAATNRVSFMFKQRLILGLKTAKKFVRRYTSSRTARNNWSEGFWRCK